ncbi:MAG TPA: pantoate--beta-alanine ligase [Elusimicrobia bacterium]|nr:pantoate--beta-alanine ligase [Elusimicrobiota bacterium]
MRSITAWRKLRNARPLKGRSVGFVPTMGALHEGHLSLVERSRRENGATLVSIFVNPTQFNDKNDLKNYPRTLKEDSAKLEAAGADFLLVPSSRELYPDGYAYRVQEDRLSPLLCGASRPGHFAGVLTVVMKLLQAAEADRAYFGRKDYQQYLLIKGMAEAFFLKTRILSCPTVRESDGLAMSSRNLLLSPEQRALAPALARTLRTAKTAHAAARELRRLGFAPDYVEDRWGRRFAAARLGKVRLIDNVRL